MGGGKSKVAGGGGGGKVTTKNNALPPKSVSELKLADDIMAIYKKADITNKVALGALRDAANETTVSSLGIAKTLKKAATPDGASHSPDFNDNFTRQVVQNALDKVAPNTYEFRRVTISNGQVIPNFNFMGMPVKGNVSEWRLFKKSGTSTTATAKAIPKSHVKVSDTPYLAANGKAPSGFGTWAFRIGGKDVFFTGKYSEAKKKAIAQAAKNGISSIQTLS